MNSKFEFSNCQFRFDVPQRVWYQTPSLAHSNARSDVTFAHFELRHRNKEHKSITEMLDDPADDDTDDSDTEQPSQKIQIMDFFKKK